MAACTATLGGCLVGIQCFMRCRSSLAAGGPQQESCRHSGQFSQQHVTEALLRAQRCTCRFAQLAGCLRLQRSAGNEQHRNVLQTPKVGAEGLPCTPSPLARGAHAGRQGASQGRTGRRGRARVHEVLGSALVTVQCRGAAEGRTAVRASSSGQWAGRSLPGPGALASAVALEEAARSLILAERREARRAGPG